MNARTRTERDSLGEVQLPADALWGAQTQRAIDNFRFGGGPMPRAFIGAVGRVKQACALVNGELGRLDHAMAGAVADAAATVAQGDHDASFPVEVFQTGSGTSTNMNANEVIAALAQRELGVSVHPNDHVNMGQSSNDVIPTCIHVAARLELEDTLLPALQELENVIAQKARDNAHVTKTGRTHLMDAMPIRLDQEMGAWAAQVRDGTARLRGVAPRLQRLAIGGTAVGTGVNAPADFGPRVAKALTTLCDIDFESSDNRFRDIASQDTAVELSGQLRGVAVSLTKIANDLRWMNSGPQAGLGEITLSALQPGSSIMPGKVNPVILEAVLMACARVAGHDASIALAGQSGSFQLNVMLPLIADSLLDSIRLLAASCQSIARQVIPGATVNEDRIGGLLARNPILVTALNDTIGYDEGARIAKLAYAEGLSIVDVAARESGLDRDTVERLLDPQRLTEPGT